MQVTIQKIAFGGEGIGFIDGKACFVEDTLPGETVEVKILHDKKNLFKAKLLKVLHPSTDRVEPPCPYVAYCGGCQYQHVGYKKELEFKESQIREIFEKNLKISSELIKPIRFSDKDYGYRNSVTLHADPKNKKPHVLAFMGRDNKSRVTVKNCLLASQALLPVFTAKFRVKNTEEEITFRLSKDQEIISSQDERFLSIKVLDEILKTSSRGFFQNNLSVTELLVQQVLKWCEFLKPTDLFDLYAGSGLFSIFAAKTAKRVFSIEESPFSLEALGMNREERALRSLTIIPGRVEREFIKVFKPEDLERPVLLMDPPRQGIARELADFISRQNSLRAIMYISCDPMTLVRDLKSIVQQGYFNVKEVIPFDMFPRTKHIETAVLLENTKPK